MFEAAGAQDYCATHSDQSGLGDFRLVHIPYVDAANHAIFDVEIGEGGIEQHRHAGVAKSDTQRGDQRPTHTDQILAPHARPGGTHPDLDTAQNAAGVSLELVEPDIVLLHHDHIQWHLAVGRFQTGQVGTEFLGIERQGFDRTSRRPPARCLGVVVRVAGNPAHLQRGVLEHEGQHLRSALEVGVDAFGRDDVADEGVQVGARRLFGVGHPVTLEDLVIRDPHAAARTGRRATEVRGLLDHDCG